MTRPITRSHGKSGEEGTGTRKAEDDGENTSDTLGSAKVEVGSLSPPPRSKSGSRAETTSDLSDDNEPEDQHDEGEEQQAEAESCKNLIGNRVQKGSTQPKGEPQPHVDTGPRLREGDPPRPPGEQRQPPGEHPQQQQQNQNVLISPLVIIASVILVVAVVYTVVNSDSDSHRASPVSKASREEIINQKFALIKKCENNFPEELGKKFWAKLRSEASRLLWMDQSQDFPAVFTIKGEDQEFINGVGLCIGGLLEKILTKKTPLHINVDTLHMDPDKQKLDLDMALDHHFNESESLVAILTNTHQFTFEGATIFYKYGDEIHAPYLGVFLVLTVLGQPEESAEATFQRVWHDRPVDILQPLLTRLLPNNVAISSAEPHSDFICPTECESPAVP